ncbi:MAG: hypothetical protein HY699_15030 [Deltaproteobacteria bacterium]|nr:hypothetical protein [Deltaproteobacteria bacterium]
MSRRRLRIIRLAASAAIAWLITSGLSLAGDLDLLSRRERLGLHSDGAWSSRVFLSVAADPKRARRHRLQLEVAGARVQTEDWLRAAGFSLLEQRDGEGRRSYTVVSDALAAQWPEVRLRAQFGGPQLSAGLRSRRGPVSVALTIPWQGYAVELESREDRTFGYSLLVALRSRDRQQRLQYGLALPMSLERAPNFGIVLQLRLRLGD